MMLTLVLFSISISLVPMLTVTRLSTHFPELIGLRGQGFALEFLMFNIPVTFFCLIPVLMLVVVLLHKLIWPVLSRLLYPVASRRVITNRTVMASVGSIFLLYALGIKQVHIEDILKLL
jgi:hypothetical protein